MSNLIGVILALIGFGVLIMVHEVGHLVAAKKSGVKVEEFWIGMGPQILKKQMGENHLLFKTFTNRRCLRDGG